MFLENKIDYIIKRECLEKLYLSLNEKTSGVVNYCKKNRTVSVIFNTETLASATFK